MEEAAVPNPALANRGAPWCVEQDAWLWDNIPGYSKDKLALIMQRTPFAVQSRLAHLAAKKITANMLTLQEAVAYTKVPALDIEKKLAVAPVYYAVFNGREGDAMYTSWEDCKKNSTGKAGAKYKKVKDESEGMEFIAAAAAAAAMAKTAVPKLDAAAMAGVTKMVENAATELNHEQQAAFDAVRRGESILLCGSAGTGKSFTLKYIVEWAMCAGRAVQQTAMTGTAALLVRGRTLHSFLGVGLARQPAMELAERTMEKNKNLVKQLRRLHTLLIDEVSMLDAGLCDKMNEYLSIIRENPAPFGGVQMVFSGDFCQIRPVNGEYAFKSASWKALAPKKHMLKTLIRQAGDMEFQDMLERLKAGMCSKADYKRLVECGATVFPDGIDPTRIYSLNKDVDCINKAALLKLMEETGGAARRYPPNYGACAREHRPRAMKWAEACGIADGVELCVGAQVVVTKNMDTTGMPSIAAEALPKLVNGSRGVVVRMTDAEVVIRLRNGKEAVVPYVDMGDAPALEKGGGVGGSGGGEKMCIFIMPLKLAWAISVHKSQGMTLDAIEVDLGGSVFEYGQAYTALSRACTLDSVKVVAVSTKAFKCHPDVYEFMDL